MPLNILQCGKIDPILVKLVVLTFNLFSVPDCDDGDDDLSDYYCYYCYFFVFFFVVFSSFSFFSSSPSFLLLLLILLLFFFFFWLLSWFQVKTVTVKLFSVSFRLTFNRLSIVCGLVMPGWTGAASVQSSSSVPVVACS